MAYRVNIYTGFMPRWRTDAKERLEQAAVELFLEQGFAETSVPQIAAHAGLTTRTFFRHFADKREVLFGVDADVPALTGRVMAQVPTTTTPLALIVSTLVPFAEAAFGQRREVLRMRHQIINTDQGLRERELRKMATLREAIVTGFLERGTDPLVARLAADLAMSVLRSALERWLMLDNDQVLSECVAEAIQALGVLVGQDLVTS